MSKWLVCGLFLGFLCYQLLLERRIHPLYTLFHSFSTFSIHRKGKIFYTQFLLLLRLVSPVQFQLFPPLPLPPLPLYSLQYFVHEMTLILVSLLPPFVPFAASFLLIFQLLNVPLLISLLSFLVLLTFSEQLGRHLFSTHSTLHPFCVM